MSKSHPRALRADEVIAVIEAAAGESRVAAMALRLAAVTGARRGELVGLQWGDVEPAVSPERAGTTR